MFSGERFKTLSNSKINEVQFFGFCVHEIYVANENVVRFQVHMDEPSIVKMLNILNLKVRMELYQLNPNHKAGFGRELSGVS
jgi:hypothetical protein